MFDRLLETRPYSLRQAEKEPLLLAGLNELMQFHYENCRDYARIIDAAWGGLRTYRAIDEVPASARLEEEVHHLLNENSRLESLLSAYRTVHEEAKEEGRPS